jgi:hypothetical protein
MNRIPVMSGESSIRPPIKQDEEKGLWHCTAYSFVSNPSKPPLLRGGLRLP